MSGAFPDGFLERPSALDVSDAGRVAVLDRDGARLVLSGSKPLGVPLDFRALRCAFHGESVIVLGAAGELRTINGAGVTMDESQTHAGAVNLAVMKSGSVVITFADGERTLERLGAHPLVLGADVLRETPAVAAASGGLWVAGWQGEAYALLLRPTAMGLDCVSTVTLPAVPTAATIGPDGALWLVAAPGDHVMRIQAGELDEPRPVPERIADLARAGSRLLGVGASGIVDLSDLIPPAPEPSPPPDLPACDV